MSQKCAFPQKITLVNKFKLLFCLSNQNSKMFVWERNLCENCLLFFDWKFFWLKNFSKICTLFLRLLIQLKIFSLFKNLTKNHTFFLCLPILSNPIKFFQKTTLFSSKKEHQSYKNQSTRKRHSDRRHVISGAGRGCATYLLNGWDGVCFGHLLVGGPCDWAL